MAENNIRNNDKILLNIPYMSKKYIGHKKLEKFDFFLNCPIYFVVNQRDNKRLIVYNISF